MSGFSTLNLTKSYQCGMALQGVPMITMGDEYGHTKGGNNNTYCHDNFVSTLLPATVTEI